MCVKVKEEEEELRDDQRSSEEVEWMVTIKRREASLDLGTGHLQQAEEDKGGVLLPAAICPKVRGRSPHEESRRGAPRSDGHGKKKKRRVTSQTRNTRFSMDENCILIERVVEKWDKLFGHLSRHTSFPAKNTMWREVVQAVNAAGVAERNIDTCKRRLNDIKRQIKTKLAELSKHRRGAGGGPPPEITFFEYEEKLIDYIDPDVIEGISGDNNSDMRAVTKHVPATASSRPETAENLDAFHNRRPLDEDSTFSFEDEELSSSPTALVQPEEILMPEDNPPHHVTQSTEQLEEASCHSIAIEIPELTYSVEPVKDTENAKTAAAQLPEERPPPVRTPWGRRRRPFLQRRLAEATNNSNQLQDTLERLVGAFKAQAQESRQRDAAVAETLLHELRQTNRSLHQIAVGLAEQAADHRNFCNQLLEEQRKISLALLVLVGNAAQLGTPGTPGLPPNTANGPAS
ncbi:uncharacterized protein ACMZJ9_014485 [Mantella aurantiaca]